MCGLVVETVLWGERGERVLCAVCVFVVVLGRTLVECGGGSLWVSGLFSRGDGFQAFIVVDLIGWLFLCVFVLDRALIVWGGGVIVGGGCSSGDGFPALHCSRFY